MQPNQIKPNQINSLQFLSLPTLWWSWSYVSPFLSWYYSYISYCVAHQIPMPNIGHNSAWNLHFLLWVTLLFSHDIGAVSHCVTQQIPTPNIGHNILEIFTFYYGWLFCSIIILELCLSSCNTSNPHAKIYIGHNSVLSLHFLSRSSLV